MATNFAAALLAVLLVIVQIVCISVNPEASTMDMDTALTKPSGLPDSYVFEATGNALSKDNDHLLSYDLASSPAFHHIENH